MKKLPPIQKIYEAYSAIAENRIIMSDSTAKVVSSNQAKEYTVTWNRNIYTSNDSATYWQGYAGYPVISALMLQEKLSLNHVICNYFKGINWTELNTKHKAKYDKAVDEVLNKLEKQGIDCKEINREVLSVFEEIRTADITVKRGAVKAPKDSKDK